jgi:hypothetical protein
MGRMRARASVSRQAGVGNPSIARPRTYNSDA